MSRPQKILYIITKSNWGGAQRYVYDLAVASKSYTLKAKSSEVVVALGGDGLLKAKLEASGIRVVTVPSLERDLGVAKDVRAFFALLSLFRREQPDVIHLNSSKAAGLGALAARLYNFLKAKSYKLKAIVTLHGLPHLEPRSIWQQQLVKFFTWVTVLLSHHTITVCEHDRRIVEKWPLVQQKIVTIWNGIDEPTCRPSVTARNEILKLTTVRHPMSPVSSVMINRKNVAFTPHYVASDQHSRTSDVGQNRRPDILIGTIAELHPNKGLDVLIEALTLLKTKSYQLKAYLIGSGELREELETLIAERGLGEHVVLAGHIENASRLLPAFDIFVLPSRKEGLPYVLIEALHAGVPIIATNVGGIPEIVTHEETGLLVATGDSAALARAIDRLAIEPELRARLGARAREHARLFSLEQMIEKTNALYGR